MREIVHWMKVGDGANSSIARAQLRRAISVQTNPRTTNGKFKSGKRTPRKPSMPKLKCLEAENE